MCRHHHEINQNLLYYFISEMLRNYQVYANFLWLSSLDNGERPQLDVHREDVSQFSDADLYSILFWIFLKFQNIF